MNCFKFILIFQTDISEGELLDLKELAKQKLKIRDLYSNQGSQPTKTTRLGRKVVPPKRLIEESSCEAVIPNKITIKKEVDDWEDMEVPGVDNTDEIADR